MHMKKEIIYKRTKKEYQQMKTTNLRHTKKTTFTEEKNNIAEETKSTCR